MKTTLASYEGRETATVTQGFASNNKASVELKCGMQGDVLGYDSDGDAQIDSKDIEAPQWVQTSDFDKLRFHEARGVQQQLDAKDEQISALKADARDAQKQSEAKGE